ncbi:GlcG/HbpS family heme-binding protein [Micromonospora sp. CA-259024]|uniref:GlcG/HbpS family heme-binding protein n=1 Tax=Micromonospora sp. CA-259024 TaxID=3239965 RepID=UPI003D907EEE
MSMLSMAKAEQILATGVAGTTEMSISVNIAVMDAGVNLKAFACRDEALFGSMDVEMGKARTLAFFQNLEDRFDFSKPGGTSFGLEDSNGWLVGFAGGRPLIIDGDVVGSVGVSGGSVVQDDAITRAAAVALGAVRWRPSPRRSMARSVRSTSRFGT